MVHGALGWFKALSIAAKKVDWTILRGSVESGNRTTPRKRSSFVNVLQKHTRRGQSNSKLASNVFLDIINEEKEDLRDRKEGSSKLCLHPQKQFCLECPQPLIKQ